MNDNEFILLMEQYFDGTLPPEGRASLRRELQLDSTRKAMFEAQARQHIRLHAQTSPIDFTDSQRIAVMVMDTVQAEHHPATFADILREQSFRERLAAMRDGLRAPRYSGRYRYARFVLWRAFMPPAITLLLCVLIIAALVYTVPRLIPTREAPGDTVDVILRHDEPPAPVDPLPGLPTPQADEPSPLPVLPASPTPPEPPPLAPFTYPVHPSVPIPARPIPGSMGIAGTIPTPFVGRTPSLITNVLLHTGGNSNTEHAVRNALQWLKTNQQADGSWSGQDLSAMTGLALLAFLGHGETPASPEFGPTIRGGIEYVLSRQDAAGHFSPNVYAHAIATYALAEALTLTRMHNLRPPLERGVSVIIRGQQPGGGFDYQYAKGLRFDTSVTGWQIQALKASQLAGLTLTGLDAAVSNSVRFLRSQAFARDGTGFVYSGNASKVPPDGGATWTMTGVGTLSLQLLGAPESPQARRGMAILNERVFEWPRGQKPWIYGQYYVTQARFHGRHLGSWDRWNRSMQPALLSLQHSDGHWEGGDYDQGSHVYTTTLCALMLEVYYRYLPTYAGSGTANANGNGVDGGVSVDVR